VGHDAETTSVLIPAHDAERLIATTLNSMLAQKVLPDEIIVIDDGSTDRTAAIAQKRSPLVRVIRRRHSGLAASRKAALEASRGMLVAHLEADDVWPADSLSMRVAALQSDPEADGVIGCLVEFASQEVGAGVDPTGLPDLDPRPGHLAGTSLLRRSCFDRVGGFDDSYPMVSDMEWVARAMDFGIRLFTLRSVVRHRRIHGRNMSLTRKSEMHQARFQLLRDRIARRHRGSGSAE
jgi:glycosyltransferase involved in cell wall biosynthesis